MNPLHVVVLILMCAILLLNIKLPPVKMIPASIILLFIVFYLFTESPILGVVGLITAYQLMPDKKRVTSEYVPNELPETLEENMVKKIVPLINQSPPHLNFKYNQEDTHDASPI